MLEDFPNSFVGLGRAFQVLLSTNLLADILSLLRGHRLLGGLVQLLDGLLVIPKIFLASNEDDGKALTEVQDLRNPLLLNIVERVRGVNGKTDQDNMGVGVGKRPETVVVFLASRIPQSQFNVLSVDFNIGDIVLENGRDIDLGEGSLGEDDKETRLSTGSVSNDDELASNFSHDGEAGVEICVKQ
jgi:hypothetical protein